MGAEILTLTRVENRSHVLGATSLLSLFFHGLLLGGLVFSLPVATIKPPPDQGISIDLETLPTPASVASASISRQGMGGEAAEPEPAAKPERAEKIAVKKSEPSRPRQAPKKIAVTKQVAIAKERLIGATPPAAAEARTSLQAAPPTPPAPAGGANAPRPPYPELARKRGQEGTVHIRCHVDANGQVADASLAKSSGHKLLDEAALKTVRKWKFRPGTNNGANVAGTVVVPVQFKLQ